MITYRFRFHSYTFQAITHLMGVQRIETSISRTILPGITMVTWKLLVLSAARRQVILALGKKEVIAVNQVIKSRGRWLEIIAKLQECVCVILNKS